MVDCDDFPALQRDCQMQLNYDPCDMVDSMTCDRYHDGVMDDCTEYIEDRNFWGMIRDAHVWHQDSDWSDSQYYIFQQVWNVEHGYHITHDYYVGEDCSHELECEWIDCDEHEIRENDHCWREDCHSECGEFECVIWHWDVENAVWDEDDCGIEEVMERFNEHEYEGQEWDLEDGISYEDIEYQAENFVESIDEEQLNQDVGMFAMAFNDTINETVSRYCYNGTCVGNATEGLIQATNLGGLIDAFLSDDELRDIANNTLGDFEDATGNDMGDV